MTRALRALDAICQPPYVISVHVDGVFVQPPMRRREEVRRAMDVRYSSLPGLVKPRAPWQRRMQRPLRSKAPQIQMPKTVERSPTFPLL